MIRATAAVALGAVATACGGNIASPAGGGGADGGADTGTDARVGDGGHPVRIDFAGTVWDGWDYDEGCPELPGPKMIAVPAPDGSRYCIDSTEVSRANYLEFTDSLADPEHVDPAMMPAYCAFDTDVTPLDSWPPFLDDALLPVSRLGWCDAWSYCRWAGKRLCGAIGGGAAPWGSHADAGASQWFNACSHGGERLYPYGSKFDPQACVGDLFERPGCEHPDAPCPPAEVRPVGYATRCEGGFPGLFDMSGNAGEWVDSCETWDQGFYDSCDSRGGLGGPGSETYMYCGFVAEIRGLRGDASGLRCCGP